MGNYLSVRIHPTLLATSSPRPSDIPIPAAKVSRLLTEDPLIPECGGWPIVGGIVAAAKILERSLLKGYARAYESDKPHT